MLQGKYRIGMNFLPIVKTLFKSPIFKFSDITSILRGMSNNAPLWDFMFSHSLENELTEYQVPVFFILGDSDFQAPHTIAERYFYEINAPQKQIFMIQNAGHFMMLDNPKKFGESLTDIKIIVNA